MTRIQELNSQCSATDLKKILCVQEKRFVLNSVNAKWCEKAGLNPVTRETSGCLNTSLCHDHLSSNDTKMEMLLPTKVLQLECKYVIVTITCINTFRMRKC